ncbi:MAG: hypothetical protein JW786_01590 [Desulfobacterales bacterium]|nr:hypothetical protein [Desulfobacterales bacterium]
MGEAKRRKSKDPYYGKIPKNIPERGIVISPPIVCDDNSLFVKSSVLDETELRFSLLYWDKLVWPSSNAVHMPSNDDAKFLEEIGVLTRPSYNFNGNLGHIIAATQIKAFRDLEAIEPGQWTMAMGENSLKINMSDFEKNEGALIELHRAIPIPTRDVPFNDILDFKERRKPELFALRHHFDQLLAEIHNSSDKQTILEKKIKEIDTACTDLLKVGREWQFPVYVSNLKASFSLSSRTLSHGAIGAWLLGGPLGLPAVSSALIGAALSTIEIKGDFGFRSIRRPSSPYRYTFKAHEEL